MAAAASRPLPANKDVILDLTSRVPIFSSEGGMVDGVLYWLKKKAAGEDEEGLTQMALDILSCPGVSFPIISFPLYCFVGKRTGI